MVGLEIFGIKKKTISFINKLRAENYKLNRDNENLNEYSNKYFRLKDKLRNMEKTELLNEELSRQLVFAELKIETLLNILKENNITEDGK